MHIDIRYDYKPKSKIENEIKQQINIKSNEKAEIRMKEKNNN